MNIKQFLNQAFYLDRLIKANKVELSNLRELSISVNTRELTKDRVQKSGHADKVGDTVVTIAELETAIQADIDKYIITKQEIRRVINSIDDNALKLILQKRYLLFHKWEQIAYETNYSYQWVHKLHKRALRELAKMKQAIESDT